MAHTFSNLLYHVVFGTKDREPSIDGELRSDLHAYLGGIIREIHGIAIIVNGTVDHVHALLKLPPTMAIADAIRIVKTNSSKVGSRKARPHQVRVAVGVFSLQCQRVRRTARAHVHRATGRASSQQDVRRGVSRVSEEASRCVRSAVRL